MGCDIHIVLEEKFKGKWVGLHAFPAIHKPRVYGKGIGEDAEPAYAWRHATSRNYNRFAKLASVRGEGEREPLGVPDDASDLALVAIDAWDGDGHSHSYMSVREAIPIFIETEWDDAAELFLNKADTRIAQAYDYFFGLALLDYGERDPDDYRIVFWFDN